MLADPSSKRALQDECRWGGRFNGPLPCCSEHTRPLAIGGGTCSCRSPLRAVSGGCGASSSGTRLRPRLLPPLPHRLQLPSSSTLAAADSEVQARYRRNLAAREARGREALLARQTTAGVVQPARTAPSSASGSACRLHRRVIHQSPA
eukprot:5689668-Pleurochrysis_carterae.AAC.2